MVLGFSSSQALLLALSAVAAFTLGYIGYRLRFHGDVHLVAGYHDGRITDETALARSIGTAWLGLGALTLAVGLADVVVPSAPTGVVWTGYTVVVLVVLGYAIRTSRRYTADA